MELAGMGTVDLDQARPANRAFGEHQVAYCTTHNAGTVVWGNGIPAVAGGISMSLVHHQHLCAGDFVTPITASPPWGI